VRKILLVCVALLACDDVTEEQLEQNSRAFESMSSVKRLSCNWGDYSAQCSGLLDGRPVRYFCKKDHCGWVQPRCD
jgi:hypothetical protein